MLWLYALARSEHDPLDFEARALAVIAGVFRRSTPAPRDVPALRRVREYLYVHFRERIAMRDLAAAAASIPSTSGRCSGGKRARRSAAA